MAQGDRRRVLDLLADGKISAYEAERLLDALDSRVRGNDSGEGGNHGGGAESVDGAGGSGGKGAGAVGEAGANGGGAGGDSGETGRDDGRGAVDGGCWRRDFGSSSSEVTIDDKIEQAVTTTVRSAVETARSIISVGGAERTAADGQETVSSERREDVFGVEGIPTLVVENFNGRVEIAGDGAEGAVRVSTAIRHPDLVEYSAVQDGDRIVVRTTPGGRGSFLGWRFLSRGAHIRISSPRRAKVEVSNSNGRVILRGIEGEGRLQTSNGRIESEGLVGKFGMLTSNSRIEAARLEGEFRLESSNGRITVRDGRGVFDAETSNGSVHFAGEMAPGGENRLATSNGSITATLGGEPSVRVSARTSNGSITRGREMEVLGERKKRRLEGVIGGGEARLTLKTSNGSIMIE